MSAFDELRFFIHIDWVGDGNFSGPVQPDTDRLIGFSLERGRKYLIDPSGTKFAPSEVGKLELKFDNSDDRYNPYNILYGLGVFLRPRLRYRFYADYNDVRYELMRGRIRNIEPVSGVPESIARITCSDGWDELQQTISMPLYQNADSETIMADILSAAGWEHPTNIGTGASTLAFWWCKDEKAIDALHELAHAELGQIYIDNDGTFRFRSRHQAPTFATTISSKDIDRTKGFRVSQPWDIVRNRIIAKAHWRTVLASNVLWELPEPISAQAAIAQEFWVDYTHDSENVPAKSVVTTPAIPADFVANTKIDGTGTNISSGFTINITPYSKNAHVSFTNYSGLDGYILQFRIRGQPIVNLHSQSVTAENGGSQNQYGVLDMVLENRWFQSINDAKDYADYLVSDGVLGIPRPYFEAWLNPNKALQLGLRLDTRYQLDLPDLGVIGSYNLIWYGHYWELKTDGMNFRTRVLFEPAADLITPTTMVFPYKFEVNSDFGL